MQNNKYEESGTVEVLLSLFTRATSQSPCLHETLATAAIT